MSSPTDQDPAQGPSPPGGDRPLLDQVKRLVRRQTERDRLERRATLRGRVKDKLFALNRQISTSLSLQLIYAQIPVFACRELGFQRALLFLDDRDSGVYTVRGSDGFYEDGARKRATAARVKADSELVSRLIENNRVAFLGETDEPELSELAETLSIDHFLAVSLLTGQGKLLGFLVAGNLAEEQADHTEIDDDSEAADGLAGAAELSSYAINHCVIYWDLAVERNMLEARIKERTEELHAAYAKMKQEVEQARDFQQSILPPPPAIDGLDIEVVYRPLDLVGGDVYDISPRPDGKLQIFVADATGHGVHASLTTMFIKGEYDQRKHLDSPSRVLKAVNDDIAQLYGKIGMRFTASCFFIDRDRREMTYSSACHPPGCRVRAGEVLELESGGPFMGLVEDVEFPEWRAPFEPGDLLCLFSDGIFEEWNPEGEIFGEERLYQAIAAASAKAERVGAEVCDRLDRFIGKAELTDDVTWIGLRWRDE